MCLFCYVILKHIPVIVFLIISCGTALKWTPKYLTDDKSTLVHFQQLWAHGIVSSLFLVKCVPVSKYNAHTEHLFKALDLLKLKDMLNLSTLKFYYQYLYDNLPAHYYRFQITTQGYHHHYNTRHSDQIHVERTRTLYADKRVRIYLHKMHGQLNSDTPSSENSYAQSPWFLSKHH